MSTSKNSFFVKQLEFKPKFSMKIVKLKGCDAKYPTQGYFIETRVFGFEREKTKFGLNIVEVEKFRHRTNVSTEKVFNDLILDNEKTYPYPFCTHTLKPLKAGMRSTVISYKIRFYIFCNTADGKETEITFFGIKSENLPTYIKKQGNVVEFPVPTDFSRSFKKGVLVIELNEVKKPKGLKMTPKKKKKKKEETSEVKKKQTFKFIKSPKPEENVDYEKMRRKNAVDVIAPGEYDHVILGPKEFYEMGRVFNRWLRENGDHVEIIHIDSMLNKDKEKIYDIHFRKK